MARPFCILGMGNLRALSNDELVESLRVLKGREDSLLGDILEHINEIERRKLYLPAGYSSLFGYLTQKMGYSDGEAYRRLESARLMAGLPEIKEEVTNGRLTLTNMTEVRTAIKAKCKKTGQSLGKSERLQLVKSVLGCTKKEAQRKLSEAIPELNEEFEEKLRELGDGSWILTILLQPLQRSRLERARDILAHKGPMKNHAEAVDRLSEFFLRKRDLTQGFDPSSESVRQSEERDLNTENLVSVAASIRRAVFKRDHGLCQFRLPFGRICGSSYRVELDHIIPRSAGGKSIVENLRCLCRAHNQWKSDGPVEENYRATTVPAGKN